MSESNGLAVVQPHAAPSIIEQVIVKGNLADLTPPERVQYYAETCRSLGLNPLTKPFDYIELDSGLTLYAKRDATDQLRKIHSVSIEIVDRQLVDGVYVVTAKATTADGRTDVSTGAVALVKEDGEWKTSTNGKRYFAGNGNFKPLGPDARANALMKAETKAKRRVTLSICGLGWMDETELDTVPAARPVSFDHETGEIVDTAPPAAPTPPQAAPRKARANVVPEAYPDETVDWTVFWGQMRARKIDAETYESIVGKKPQSYASPQEALDALTAAEAGIVAEQPAMFAAGDPDRHTR